MLNKSDLNRVIVQLKQFDCNPTEARVYVQALQTGPTTVQEIARKLSSNRVTIYSAMEQLLKKGLLFETRQGKKRLVVAEDPAALRRILQTKYNDLKLLENNLDYVTELLTSVQTRSKSVPTVKVYEDVEGFKRLLEETLTAKGEVLVFTHVDLFSKLLEPAYLEHYFKRRAAKGIHTRLIFPPCAFAELVHQKAREYKIEVRLLPAHMKWKSGFFLWNNCVALKAFTEGRYSCTIIENEDIAYFFRHILYEMTWSQARPME